MLSLRLRIELCKRQWRFRERLRWLRATGLPPTDDRGFVPRRDGDERYPTAEILRQMRREEIDAKRLSKRLPKSPPLAPTLLPDPKDNGRMRPTWSLPARPDDASPGWDNVVRAYEEDR